MEGFLTVPMAGLPAFLPGTRVMNPAENPKTTPWRMSPSTVPNMKTQICQTSCAMKMDRLGACLSLALACAVPSTFADILTHFEEAVLIPEIQLDIPDGDLAEIVLDTSNDELLFQTFGNTDMWGARANAPVAWTPSPGVAEGEMWAVETHVRYNGQPDAAQRVAGLMFYPDFDGAGGASDGVNFGYGINDWDNRSIEIQGFGGAQVGDAGVPFINTLAAVGHVSSAYLRVEILENGFSDRYTFYYKLEAQDPWTRLAEFNSDQDNSRVGLFFKNGSATAPEDRSVSFTYFRLVENAALDADGDGISDEYEIANGLNPNNPSDRNQDTDDDGLTNYEEFRAGTRADNPDTDGDGLRDGVETNTGIWVSAANTGTNPLSSDTDRDGLPDGMETNTGIYVSAANTGTDPHNADTDGDLIMDGREVALGSDPTKADSLPAGEISQGGWNVGLDIPDWNIAAITYDAGAGELVFKTEGNTDMWGTRANAPVAWVPDPGVAEGEMWAVETHVRYNGQEDGAERVAGLMFYPDVDGMGGASDGVDFGYGINDWNNRSIEIQGFGGAQVGDSGVPFINTLAAVGHLSSAYLRVEILENGFSDQYSFYYKLEAQDPWTLLAELNSDQDNSRVGLFFKNGSATAPADRSVSFTYFRIDAGPLPSAFQITQVTRGAGGVTLVWPSEPGMTYSIDRRLNLASGTWTELQGGVPSAGVTTSFTDASVEILSAQEAWYRVRQN